MFLSNKKQKPSYLFIFSDEQQSELFYEFASKHFHATNVQHPYGKDGRSRDLLRVLVIASGSQFFDMTLKNELDQKATELGGYYLPKV